MKRITSGFFCSSVRMLRMRSSNCPRYFVPATTAAMSKAITLLSNRMRDNFFCTMRKASPSTMADFPTPGSPINIGLFFFRRLRICDTRSISFSRPTTGSRMPSWAARVRSVPKLSKTGVLLADFLCGCTVCVVVLPCSFIGFPAGDLFSYSSSSSSSGKPKPDCTSDFSAFWVSRFRMSV